MAQDIVNKNQDISYTNLDFSSIYPEALELIKQLSYRWDPSISDESDPGVVLLKLSALIADKMNYNIDKSVLEAFPLSVTQEENARQLYEQLGYYMNWYESAIVPVNISWIGSELSDEVLYTIPKFTIITDSESSRSYALIGTIDTSGLVVSDGKLAGDGTILQMIAMEGTPTVFSFLGETVITSQMVDEKNRLYFETKYVSQNGIFIKNVGNDQDNYLEWKRVDNLYEQPYSDLRYKFGIDSEANVAYIEFPDNYAELIGSGIEIVYMIIEPDFSNIPPKTLDRFLVNFSPAEASSITLSLDNVKIENLFSASGHKNIESIDEAYVGYKRTVGTFKTLITLRDYLNYILLEGKALSSNGFVTDRSNDPQLSYKIMSTVNGMDSLITEIESDAATITYSDGSTEEKDIPKLTPFSLKFYLLQDAVVVNSKNTFEQTFEMISSEDLPSLSALIDETAHIQHTYEDILPADSNIYKPTLDETRLDKSYYKEQANNRFDFVSNGFYYLAVETEPIQNEKYFKYNTQYDIYYEVTVEAGQSPAALGLYKYDDLSEYEEVDPSELGWYEIDVPAFSQHLVYFRAKYPINMTITTYSVVGADVQADIKQNVLAALYEGLNSTQIEFGDRIELDYLTEIVLAADSRIRTVVFDNLEYRIEAIYYDKERGFQGVILPTEIELPSYSDELQVKSFEISKEIVAKSILAGTTKLLDKDTQFEYHIDQNALNKTDGIYSIESEAIIDMDKQANIYMDGKINKSYTLKDNEVLTLFRPKLNEIRSFQNGVHFEYLLYSDVKEYTSYKLSKTEYMIMYDSILDSNDNITGYTCRVYTNGAIIKPTFNLEKQNSQLALSEYFRTQIQPSIELSENNSFEFSTNSVYWTNYITNNPSLINNIIMGSNDITVQEMNTVTIVPDDGYKFYWQLNDEKRTEVTGKKYYELFGSYDPNEDKRSNSEINTYTLKSGETLYYVDNNGKNIAILHEGTTITRSGGLNSEYQDIAPTEYYSFVSIDTEGITAVADLSPAALGYYELQDTTYVPTTDEEPEAGKTYYVLVMNSMVGNYEKHIDENDRVSYTLSPSITYDIFDEVVLDNLNEINTANPSENGFYEKVEYLDIIIEDTYAAKVFDGNGEEIYSEQTKIARPRYKQSTDSSVISPIVYSNIFNNLNVNNVSSYPSCTDVFNSILIDSSTAAAYSPKINQLYEVNTSDAEYYTFYTYDGEVYTEVPSTDLSIDSIPIALNWYENIGTQGEPNYILSNKVYAYEPKKVTPSDAVIPFIPIDSSNAGTGLGLYYKVGANDTYFLKRNAPDKHIKISESFNNIPNQLYARCQALSYIGTLNIANLVNQWDPNISTAPSAFMYKTFSEQTTNPKYYKAPDSILSNLVSQVQTSLTSDSQIYPVSDDEYVLDVELCKNIGIVDNNGPLDPLVIGQEPSGYATITDDILSAWYHAIQLLGNNYTNVIILYLIPNYYRFRYLQTANVDKYYKLKTYATTTFTALPPWECDAITADSIINSPSDTLGSYWKTLQDNCSLTIVENDLYSLTTGDTLSITSNEDITSDILAGLITWPYFSNTTIILNLNNYSISYTKSNNEVITLDSIDIVGAEWRGYSSLLINTSSDAGQKLAQNHRITFYGENDNQLLYIGADTSGDSDVKLTDDNTVYQLQYPVNNQAGSRIQVITYDELGNEIPNSVYVYKKLLSKDDAHYTISYSSTHETSVTFKDVRTVSVPFEVTLGEYLIPFTGNPDVTVSATFGNSVVSNFADSTIHEFTGNKTYYLYINKEVDNNSTDELNISIGENDPVNTTIVLGDIFKFNKRYTTGEDESINTDLYDEIFTKMKQLDTNSIYNYTYQPNANDLIENPLDPKMFWDKNHIFNENTIAQLDTNSSDNISYRFITSR